MSKKKNGKSTKDVQETPGEKQPSLSTSVLVPTHTAELPPQSSSRPTMVHETTVPSGFVLPRVDGKQKIYLEVMIPSFGNADTAMKTVNRMSRKLDVIFGIEEDDEVHVAVRLLRIETETPH